MRVKEVQMEQDFLQVRKEKLEKFKAAGINPYPAGFQYTHSLSKIKDEFDKLGTGEMSEQEVKVCGRIISRREMGKASFFHIQDMVSKLQIYIKKDQVGEDKFKIFIDLIDIGDFVGLTGKVFRTRTGELTVNTTDWQLLSKSLRPLPEKWHGLKDVDVRYRQRYLDLISNQDVKEIFVKRSKIINFIRECLVKKDFLEVETPIVQHLAGGALARPFKTHHNAYDTDMFMRIAPELPLKMLVVGGLERVFEIGKSFRNEGVDRNHNPEFTTLEAYQAYTDYNGMIDLCKEIINYLVTSLNLEKEISFEDKIIQITNFRIVTMSGLFKEEFGDSVDIIKMSAEEGILKEFAKKINIEVKTDESEKKILDHIFDQMIQPKLVNPTFVTDYPIFMSPLAKAKDAFTVERFELFIGGLEVANAYSELNDPQEQRARFVSQTEKVHPMDEDFIVALEHGLPPCGGLGIGIDRLTMVLANASSIREVILFPLLRNEETNRDI